MSGCSILIVEDNAEFRQILSGFLKHQEINFLVFEVGSAEEAIEKSKIIKPQIVLMDIRLPAMNGIEASYRLKEISPDSIIIVLTMFEKEEFKKVHCNGVIKAVLGKSELFEHLMPVIRKALQETGDKRR